MKCEAFVPKHRVRIDEPVVKEFALLLGFNIGGLIHVGHSRKTLKVLVAGKLWQVRHSSSWADLPP